MKLVGLLRIGQSFFRRTNALRRARHTSARGLVRTSAYAHCPKDALAAGWLKQDGVVTATVRHVLCCRPPSSRK